MRTEEILLRSWVSRLQEIAKRNNKRQISTFLLAEFGSKIRQFRIKHKLYECF